MSLLLLDLRGVGVLAESLKSNKTSSSSTGVEGRLADRGDGTRLVRGLLAG